MLARDQAEATQMLTTQCERGTRNGAREKMTPCEWGADTVWTRIKILVVWRTRRMLSLSKPTKHTVCGVPSERNPVVYILVWTQSYSPVRRKHWVYICICISCVCRECEYSLHLSLFHVHLENERVYSLLVFLENECVYKFHVYLSTHWSLQVQTLEMFMSAGLRDARVELQM